MSFNRPHMQLPNQPPNTTVRWVHQALSLEHDNGKFHFTIHENGKVTIKGNAQEIDGVIEEDEIEVPASLIYKISRYLMDTRKATFLPIEGK